MSSDVSNIPITVLCVDDNPHFVELTELSLEQADDDISVITAESATEGLELLPDADCVLSDFDMPDVDGLAFLAAVREEDEDLPFILFTGRGNEEIASEAISAGVTDYVRKNRGQSQFELLANKIANGVAHHRAQRERRRTIERMTDAIIELDANWRVTTVDSRAEELCGMDAEEMLDRNLWDLFPDAVDTQFYDDYHRVMETREPTTLEEYYEDLDRLFQVNVYPNTVGGLSIYFWNASERGA